MNKIKVGSLPANPLMVSGAVSLQLSTIPILDYSLPGFSFFYNLGDEANFTNDKYKNTSLYGLAKATDSDKINNLLNSSKKSLFNSSYPFANTIEMSLVFNTTVFLDMEDSQSSLVKVETNMTGTLLKGVLKVSYDFDIFSSQNSIGFGLNMTFGKFRFMISLVIAGKRTKVYENILAEDPTKIINLAWTTIDLPFLDYENDADKIEETATPITTDCQLNESDSSYASCYSDFPCGSCVLFPNVYEDSTNYVPSKKGIDDACEVTEPIINQEYFNYFRLKKNCKTPFQVIQKGSCKPKEQFFYIGEGYPLSLQIKNSTNFTDLKELPDEFFSGATVTTSNKALNYTLSNETLKFYNDLFVENKTSNYSTFFNERKYYEDLINKSNASNSFQNLTRSIRTAFYLFMDNFETKNGQNDETLMAMLRAFYKSEYSMIIDFCSTESNQVYCESNNLLPILTLLKYSCNKCNFTESSLNVQIIFILDGSGSIYSSDFAEQKIFLSNFVDLLKENKKMYVEGAAIQFSSSADLISNFTNDTTTLASEINKTKQMERYTETGKAFDMAADLFTSSDFNGSRFVFIITDGGATSDYTNGLETLRNASAFTMIAVGVGSGINSTELFIFTGDWDYVYYISTFNSLNFMQNVFGSEICYGIVEAQDSDFSDNKTLDEGYTQVFYRLKYKKKHGKMIIFSKVENGTFYVYASLKSSHPNKNYYEFKSMIINGSIYLIIPKEREENSSRLLQTTTEEDSPFYLSYEYNLTSNTTIQVQTVNSINVNLSCFENCISCDESGQICYACKEEFALADNKCNDLKIAESLAYVNIISGKQPTKQEDTINDGNLAGLIFFIILEVLIFVALILIGCKLIKKRKDNYIPKEGKATHMPVPITSP